MKQNSKESMKQLIEKMGMSLIPFKEGEVMEVKVLGITRERALVNLGIGLGIVPAREFSLETPSLKEGDKALAYLISLEGEDGYAILSFRRADKERVWQTLREKYLSGTPLEVTATQANKGGLIVEYGKVEGFLPASQLALSHYPKVTFQNPNTIIKRLSKLLGQRLRVKIISLNETRNELIFSEKALGDPLYEKKISKIKIGQEMIGKITGIADFGLFVDLGGIDGLVHLSEIPLKVKNFKEKFKVGDKVKVRVINLEKGRISLSLKKVTKSKKE